MIGWVNEACAAGARQSKACEVIGLSSRTLQRWRENGQVKADGRGQPASRSEPHSKLSPLERQRILEHRRLLYEVAKDRLPGRWSGKTRNWTPIETVFLNPGKPAKKEVELKQNAA
ncbi:MAG: hypothetical protein U9Q05_01405 [Thermodesulfobacteriota bacterium]|nr:hypothetical protein [Thermodesulfobacteriota bacterium]